MDTSGFYKKMPDDYIFYAPNEVSCLAYTIKRTEHETYDYPVDGWYWFDSQEEAYAFFNEQK